MSFEGNLLRVACGVAGAAAGVVDGAEELEVEVADAVQAELVRVISAEEGAAVGAADDETGVCHVVEGLGVRTDDSDVAATGTVGRAGNPLSWRD